MEESTWLAVKAMGIDNQLMIPSFLLVLVLFQIVYIYEAGGLPDGDFSSE